MDRKRTQRMIASLSREIGWFDHQCSIPMISKRIRISPTGKVNYSKDPLPRTKNAEIILVERDFLFFVFFTVEKNSFFIKIVDFPKLRKITETWNKLFTT